MIMAQVALRKDITMKYRGFELIESDSRQNELCCGVYVSNEKDVYDVEDEILDIVSDMEGIYTEAVLDDFIEVRGAFSFDKVGVEKLKSLYDLLNESVNSKIAICVHLDDWFVSENGNECNMDEVSWD